MKEGHDWGGPTMGTPSGCPHGVPPVAHGWGRRPQKGLGPENHGRLREGAEPVAAWPRCHEKPSSRMLSAMLKRFPSFTKEDKEKRKMLQAPGEHTRTGPSRSESEAVKTWPCP